MTLLSESGTNILAEDGSKVLIGTKLTEISSVGSSYFHKYKLNNEEYNVECSQSEYNALKVQGAGAPSLPNGSTWLGSFAGTKFNTSSGRIENGQFYISTELGGVKVVKLPNKPAGVVASDKIVNNELDQTSEAVLNQLVWR